MSGLASEGLVCGRWFRVFETLVACRSYCRECVGRKARLQRKGKAKCRVARRCGGLMVTVAFMCLFWYSIPKVTYVPLEGHREREHASNE